MRFCVPNKLSFDRAGKFNRNSGELKACSQTDYFARIEKSRKPPECAESSIQKEILFTSQVFLLLFLNSFREIDGNKIVSSSFLKYALIAINHEKLTGKMIMLSQFVEVEFPRALCCVAFAKNNKQQLYLVFCFAQKLLILDVSENYKYKFFLLNYFFSAVLKIDSRICLRDFIQQTFRVEWIGITRVSSR